MVSNESNKIAFREMGGIASLISASHGAGVELYVVTRVCHSQGARWMMHLKHANKRRGLLAAVSFRTFNALSKSS